MAGGSERSTYTRIEAEDAIDGEAGWVRCEFDDVPFPVDVRLAQRGDRTRIVAVYLVNEDGIDATPVRAIRLGAIEGFFNVHPTWVDTVEDEDTSPRPLKPAVKRAQQAARQVKVPERPPYGIEFYRRVAASYRACVAAELPPGPTLAAAQGVTVTQAHHWIRTARHRGLLPAGRSGKTG